MNTGRLILFSFILFLVFAIHSCGPRSGVHNETRNGGITGNDKKEEVFACGNAAMEAQNDHWAETTLGITGDGERGRKLFKQNCAVCHDIMERQFTGPGLKGVYDRIPEPKATWLKNYIKNSLKVQASGDKYARALRKKYPENTMNTFEDNLTDKDINDIMIYVVGNAR